MEAAGSGFIRPLLVGPLARIRAVAAQFNIDLGGVEILDPTHSHAAAARAVALIREGSAEILIPPGLGGHRGAACPCRPAGPAWQAGPLRGGRCTGLQQPTTPASGS